MTFNGDDIARDRNGNPILDRYGRPVRKRRMPSTPRNPQPPQRRPRREPAPEAQRPQQYIPPAPQPRQPAYQPRPTYQPPAQPAYQRPPRPPVSAPPVKRRKALPKPKGCLGTLAFLLVTLLVLTFVTFLWADTKLTRVEALPAQPIKNTAGTNWLLVGSDSRQGLSQEEIDTLQTGDDIGIGRTDTIMLLHIPRSGQPTLVSIPRDSYVNIPGYGQDKINSAFTNGGPQLLTTTVEQATGLRIDHYAEIGFGGFAGMVDAVGGVNICVEQPIDDEVINFHVPAGCQEMDGPTALSFVRTRHSAMGDLDRVQRQRQFFSALMSKATSASTLANPFRVFPLITKAGSSFIVGDGDHSWDLARLALAMRGGVKNETVPVGGFADTAVGSVVLWDEAASEALFAGMR
ncbi:LCP family protein [Corynebacterium epidermidicanis]|uniref:Transcriptional attenuator, LytR family n=1 Tax=Corynebacterium epidermidicanis TaxID=1050174 RepID=A0A0G3GZF1_9CORY|nr:LCP family protein [Corynebacterium epidermidicanis]AKK04182.1 transcriptional attenuator, LytR family [Corynebacterium epidermidicanis]